MTMAQVMNIVNQNFRDIQDQSSAQIIRSEKDGKKKIIIGKLPDDEYGIVIANDGYDVVDDVFVVQDEE